MVRHSSQSLVANTKELAVFRGKRTPETLEDWARAFGEGDRKLAEKYALAIATFIGSASEGDGYDYLGQLSPNTRKAYAFSVTEFFEWLVTRHDRVVPPHLVTRKDAEEYVQWLANRQSVLFEEKLKDGDAPVLLGIYETIKKLKSAKIRQIVPLLPEDVRDRYFKLPENSDSEFSSFSHVLRKLIVLDLVKASPTLEELRKDHPETMFGGNMVLKDNREIPFFDIFVYTINHGSPVSRTTIALRLAALTTFWKSLMRGENVSGGEALLQYNIWDEVKTRVNRGLTPMKKAAARNQKVPAEVVLQMLEKAPTKNLTQLRNRAILYLMVFAGLRTTELLQIRRGKTGSKLPHFDGSEPPALQILRKGNKWMKIPYPPIALQALIEFQTVLSRNAAPENWQHLNPQAPHYVPYRVAYYYRDLLLADAPLFPSLIFWGNNERREAEYRRSMTRINLYKIVQLIAQQSGVPQDLVEQVHPHALRHFSANAMHLGGKDLREIQYILGHSSIVTTEGYLEDIDDQVKLSGQSAILDYLKSRGVQVEQPTAGVPEKPKKKAEVVDTYAVSMDDLPEEKQVPKEKPPEPEVVIRRKPRPVVVESPQPSAPIVVVAEKLPSNDLPEAPKYSPPAAKVIDTSLGEILAEEGQLIGVTTEEPAEEVLRQISGGETSPGSPDWVYEALKKGRDMEPVVFNRGAQPDIAWLKKNYPDTPSNFGLGRKSLLGWYVKAPGKVSASGHFRKLAPFPLWSPDQVSPETAKGRALLDAVERLYTRFVEGRDGVAASPVRSAGLVRWYGFFSYMTNKFVMEAPRTKFDPWDVSIEVSEAMRSHKEEWLYAWLETNSHTFRASVDAMKRGVPRGAEAGTDLEAAFLRASFEGVDLIEQMPEWMTANDPVHALYEEDPEKFDDFIKWLRNVTGQALSADRKDARSDAKRSVLKDAESIKGLLLLMYEGIDKVTAAKHQGAAVRREDEILGSRKDLRMMLYSYLLKAAKVEKSDEYPLKALEKDSTTEFNRRMTGLLNKYKVPNPNDPKYREIPRVKDRIDAMIRALFPEEKVLADANIFADSALFDPKWFRIDEENNTIYIEPEAAKQLQTSFGIQQNPVLLVRRAARAMYEAKDKGYDKLWGVMMSYFSYIVPTGAEMEADARGIPSRGAMEDSITRQRWLSGYVSAMRDIAEGKDRQQIESDEEDLGIRNRGDLLDKAMTSVDFVFLASDPAWSTGSPEDALIQAEDEENYYLPNRSAKFSKNGKSRFLHVVEEKPKGWYRVDIYGSRRSMRKNPEGEVFISPAIVQETQQKLEPARMLLPSPFRMLMAMDQGMSGI